MSRLTFLYQMDLPHRAVAVYTYLHDRANKNGECWPSVKTCLLYTSDAADE